MLILFSLPLLIFYVLTVFNSCCAKISGNRINGNLCGIFCVTAYLYVLKQQLIFCVFSFVFGLIFCFFLPIRFHFSLHPYIVFNNPHCVSSCMHDIIQVELFCTACVKNTNRFNYVSAFFYACFIQHPSFSLPNTFQPFWKTLTNLCL